jgi:hypothetical protein
VGEANLNQGENLGFETDTPRQGTSDSVISATVVYGQEETVMSQGRSHRIPGSVSLSASLGGSGKRFKLFRVPHEDKNFSELCRSLIGKAPPSARLRTALLATRAKY